MTVYRGVGHPDYAQGFAWTLDRDKAVWFAGYASREVEVKKVTADCTATV